MSTTDTPQERWAFAVGQEVRGADGESVGHIVTVSRHHIQIERGFLFKHDFSVPKSAIHVIRDGVVFLGVPAAAIERAGWETEPPPGGVREHE